MLARLKLSERAIANNRGRSSLSQPLFSPHCNFGTTLRQLWHSFSKTLGHLWITFGTHLRHLGDNFWTTDNFGTIWWLRSDCWQSIPLPRGQHIGIFKIRFYSILQHFERCECPIRPNQKNCVTFNFQFIAVAFTRTTHCKLCLPKDP